MFGSRQSIFQCCQCYTCIWCYSERVSSKSSWSSQQLLRLSVQCETSPFIFELVVIQPSLVAITIVHWIYVCLEQRPYRFLRLSSFYDSVLTLQPEFFLCYLIFQRRCSVLLEYSSKGKVGYSPSQYRQCLYKSAPPKDSFCLLIYFYAYLRLLMKWLFDLKVCLSYAILLSVRGVIWQLQRMAQEWLLSKKRTWQQSSATPMSLFSANPLQTTIIAGQGKEFYILARTTSSLEQLGGVYVLRRSIK